MVYAAIYGLPIIMTDVGLAGEVIKNNESGLVISIGNEEELIKSMRKMISDKALREELANNARIAVENLPSKVLMKF